MEKTLDSTHDINKWDHSEDNWLLQQFVASDAVQEVFLLSLRHLAYLHSSLSEVTTHEDAYGRPIHFLQKPNGFVIYSLGASGEDKKGAPYPTSDNISFSYPYVQDNKPWTGHS
jgi:hypothetical protein